MVKKKTNLESFIIGGLIIAGLLMIVNQVQISGIVNALSSTTPGAVSSTTSVAVAPTDVDLSNVDVNEITSTAMAIKTVLPEVNQIKNQDDAISIMISTGTPPYGDALGGISFDEPVMSMEYLAKWYYSLKEEVKQNNPQTWQRYLNLAAAPRGISCEFCCGVGPQGIDSQGNLRCGCKHNPAAQAVALGLMKNTDYSDAQILREVMKWKALFFPKKMVELSMEVAGTDVSSLKSLPGMVGGC